MRVLNHPRIGHLLRKLPRALEDRAYFRPSFCPGAFATLGLISRLTNRPGMNQIPLFLIKR